MPGGLFRGLAQAAVEGYYQAKADAASQARVQNTVPNASSPHHTASGQPAAQYTYPPPPQQAGFSGQQAGQYGYHPQSLPPAPPPYQAAPPPPPLAASPPKKEVTPQTTVQEIRTTTPTIITSNSCIPFEAIPGGRGYCTSSIPDMDVCPACYSKYIATTPFAPSFRAITYPSGSEHNCDLALLAIRNAWSDVCARGGPNPSPQEKEIWLGQLNQRYTQTSEQLKTLLVEIQSLKQEIEVAQVQAQYQQASAFQQIRFGMNMRVWGDNGDISQQMGNNRFMEVSQMRIDIARKQGRLQQALAQVKALAGMT